MSTSTSPVQRWILDSQRELLRRLQVSAAGIPVQAASTSFTREKV
jgi:hypothetical protein